MWLCCCGPAPPYTFVKWNMTSDPPIHDWTGHSLVSGGDFDPGFDSATIRRIIATSDDDYKVQAATGGWSSSGAVDWDVNTGIQGLVANYSSTVLQGHDIAADGSVYGSVSASQVRKVNSSGTTQWTATMSTGSPVYVDVCHSSAGLYVKYPTQFTSQTFLALYNESGTEQFNVELTNDGYAYLEMEGAGSLCVMNSNKNAAGGSEALLRAFDSSGSEAWKWPLDSDYEKSVSDTTRPGLKYRNGHLYVMGPYLGDQHIFKVSTSGVEQDKWDISGLGFAGGTFGAQVHFDVDSSENFYFSRYPSGVSTVADLTKFSKYNSSLTQQWTIDRHGSGEVNVYIDPDDVLYTGSLSVETPT